MKLFALLLPTLLFAFFMPSDEQYYIHQDDEATIIYTQNHKNIAKRALSSYKAIGSLYQNSFAYKPATKPHIVIASRQNQIANAWATAIPYPQMTIYGGGASEIDYFGFDSWIDTIVAHEGAHIYQLDSKDPFSQQLEKVFGHNRMPIFPVVPIPLFTKPNILLPDLFLEGNAVYNESKITRSGRMYGGRHKALLMALAKSGKLSASRLINNHRDFPYLEEKYIVGAYFQAFLDKKRLDRFFMRNAEHYINPFLLNNSFITNYQMDLYRALDLFIDETTKQSQKFLLQDGKVIASSKRYEPIGSNADEIILFATDLATNRSIIQIDKKRRAIITHSGNYLAGKPFCFDGACFTQASGHTATNRIENSLFDSDQKPLANYNGKVLQDRFNGKDLYIKIDKSFNRAKLYEGSNFVATIASSARYAPDGTIYTIQKNGALYTLFAGKKPLFSLRTHFVLADISNDGKVLFVANSALGSGLYLYKDGEISRAIRGDNVLDAKFLSGDELVVSVITADEYQFLHTRLDPIKQLPTRAKNNFEDEPQIDLTRQIDLTLQDKSYNSLKMLKFSNIYPALSVVDDGVVNGSLDINFVDPLQYNMINVGYIHEEKSFAYAGYHNQKYRAFFGATYFAELNGTRKKTERDYGADLYLGYKLLQTNTKDLNLILRQIHDPDSKTNTPNIVQIGYKYAIQDPLAHKAKQFFALDLFAKQNNQNSQESAYGYKAQVGSRLFWQTYLDLTSKHSKSKNGYLLISEQKPIKDPLNFELINMPLQYAVQDITSQKAEISSAINTPIYFSSFPFGLHQIAPKVSYERLDLANGKLIITEKSYAIEAKILFAHRFDLDIEIGIANNTTAQKDKLYFMLKI